MPRILVPVLAGWLCGCGSEDASTGPAGGQVGEVAEVTVTPGAATLTRVGATVQFEAAAEDASGNPVTGIDFVWQSGDEEVAVVDEDGLATAVRSGAATITATARGIPGNATLTVDQTIAVLAFITGPSDGAAGEAIDPPIRLEVRDAGGSPVLDAEIAVTLSLLNNPGSAALAGTPTVDAEAGVAVFSDLSLDRAAVGYTLSATAADLDPVISAPFAISPAAAARLGLLSEPGTAEGKVPFDPAVQVAIQDTFGNTVTDATADVTVALSVTPSGEALSGTTTVPAVNGVAAFDDLSLALPGDGFVLEASSGSLTPAVSGGFGVRLTFVQVSVGVAHTCGITASDFAYCWGKNQFSQLGDSTGNDAHTPTPVAGGHGFTRISAGGDHTCGVTTGDIAYCWGSNSFGQLGDGTAQGRDTPTQVAGGLSFVRISAGRSHTCGVTPGNLAYCWGRNLTGQLGVGIPGDTDMPTQVAGGLIFARIGAGSGHTCGVTTGNVAYCWGSNFHGQLGDDMTDDRDTPTAVAGGFSFAEVSAGGSHTCGITTGNIAYCWGNNAGGQLGDGTTDNAGAPTPVAEGLSFARVSAGANHTCGFTAGNIAYCWGPNPEGQLGDGTTDDTATPTPVAEELSFARVGAGGDHTCGITTGNIAYCWGRNESGQLGDGTSAERNTPTQVVQ